MTGGILPWFHSFIFFTRSWARGTFNKCGHPPLGGTKVLLNSASLGTRANFNNPFDLLTELLKTPLVPQPCESWEFSTEVAHFEHFQGRSLWGQA